MIRAAMSGAPKDCRTSGSEGFTLVEMLVALSLTALLSSLLVAAVVQVRPMQKITASVEGEADLIGAADYLKDLLGKAQKIALLENDPSRKVVFEGQASSVRFVAINRVGSERTSLRDVQILVRPNDTGFDLIQRQRARRVIIPPPVEEFAILSELKSVSLEYLDRKSEGRWQQDWRGKEGLPDAVRLRLVAERAGREMTVEEIAIPAIN